MNPAGIRRKMKNVVHNYTEPQKKVREATSNDPWGPSSTLMGEIADLTYNVVAFSEIMLVVWKRLNDHGKNWRHVYKGLVLLEYLIKTGSEKVAQQCKENIFAIQTLKDFQYIEENKDQGLNVREKAKMLVELLKDDERLRNERARAIKAKERFAQASATAVALRDPLVITPTTGYRATDLSEPGGDVAPPRAVELEIARPQTAGEEELQLQLALAMSKEEAEQEEQRRRSDDVRLQMAITQSEEDFKTVHPPYPVYHGDSPHTNAQDQIHENQRSAALMDWLDIVPGGNTSALPSIDPWGMPISPALAAVPPLPPTRTQSPPLNGSALDDLLSLNLSSPLDDTSSSHLQSVDPWSPVSNKSTTPVPTDPWTGRPASSLGVPISASSNNSDPWNTSLGAVGGIGAGGDTWANSSFGSTPSLTTNGDLDGFDLLGMRPHASSKSTNNLNSSMAECVNPANNYLGMGGLLDSLPNTQPSSASKKTPESFLGENSSLVNLDSLVSAKTVPVVTTAFPTQTNTNPFASQPNPFQSQQAQPRVSLNQLRNQPTMSTTSIGYPAPTTLMAIGPQMTTPMPMTMPLGPMPMGMMGAHSQPVTNNPFL